MKQKFKCPMLCGMQTMYEPELMGIHHDMPMEADIGMDSLYKDEEDEVQFMEMYPESCRRIMVFVKVEIDIMEDMDEMLMEDRPDVGMIDTMTDNAYKKLVRENPEQEEAGEAGEARQYPAGAFTRDLLRVLLLNELLKRRRRYRRMNYYGYPPYGAYDNYDYYDYEDYYNY